MHHELQVGSMAHYLDPTYYTHAYRKRNEDIHYYCARASELQAQSILEYGCGTGRILLPLARQGYEVTGVDHSKPMLAKLKATLASETKEISQRVSLRHGDMRNVQIKKKFSLILATFNTFLHLYTRHDVEQFLARVRMHLQPQGRFIFDMSTPSLVDLSRDSSKALYTRPFKHPTLGVRCRYSERFDYDPIQQILFVAMQFEPIGDSHVHESWVTPLTHRQFFPAEVEALLHYNGFKVTQCEGGFNGEPADRYSDVLIWTSKLDKKNRKT